MTSRHYGLHELALTLLLTDFDLLTICSIEMPWEVLRPADSWLACMFVVGVTRFELVASSVSGKRSPPELNAHICAPMRRISKQIY